MTGYINLLCVPHVLIVSYTHTFPDITSFFAYIYVADEQLSARFLSGYTWINTELFQSKLTERYVIKCTTQDDWYQLTIGQHPRPWKRPWRAQWKEKKL